MNRCEQSRAARRNCLAAARLAWPLAAALAAACCGCGATEFPKVQLAGTVTVDGQPIEEGTISFQPQGKGQGPGTSAAIVRGKYRAPAPRGPLKVFIQATKETGKIVNTAGSPHPERVNLIPAQYHGGIEIDTSDGKSQRDFPLVSDEPP